MRVDIRGRIELDEIHVGDVVDLALKVQVVGLEDALIDVTSMRARETKVMVGERTANLLILRGGEAE